MNAGGPIQTSKPQTLASQSALSVSDLNRKVKFCLESEFPQMWVRGELSNFTAHSSGHWYFSLKDNKSQIAAVMFRANNQTSQMRPKNGDEVLVRARLAVYEPRGNYQLVCESMEALGAGLLQRQFEELKKKLAAEGLFAPQRKQPLPKFPRRLAVVSSPTGAAIRDILQVLHRRHRALEVWVFPCKVQGDSAAREIREQVARANELGFFDAMIVGRGGGSIEDLWCFNDEALAREIAQSAIPVISAVGHEIDFSICDFVADLRAPTPSAAAELVSAHTQQALEFLWQSRQRLQRSLSGLIQMRRQEIGRQQKALARPQQWLEPRQQQVDDLQWRLQRFLRERLQSKRQRLAALSARLQSPQQRLQKMAIQLQAGQKSLIYAMETRLHQSRQRLRTGQSLAAAWQPYAAHAHNRLGRAMAKLDSLSPLRVLERGYAIAQKENRVLSHTRDLKSGDLIQIRLHAGQLRAQIIAVEEK